MRILADEGHLVALARSGWRRTGNRDSQSKYTNLRVGIITRRNPVERAGYLIYGALEKEAVRRQITLVKTPSYRMHRRTAVRNRADLSKIPWAEFDVALLLDSEDAQTLGDSILSSRPVICVDEDATDYGLPSVAFDNECAGRLLASYLFEAGHRSFAAIQECNDAGWTNDSSWAARLYGFEKQLGRMGGCVLPEWRIPTFRHSRLLTFDGVSKQFASRWLEASRNVRPCAVLFTEGSIFLKYRPLMQQAGLRIGSELTPVTVTAVETAWPAPEVARAVFSTATLAELALNMAAELADTGITKLSRQLVPPVLIKPIT